MIFYRSSNGQGSKMSVWTVRTLIAASLAAYPAGAIAIAALPAEFGGRVVGLCLIFVSLLCALPILGSDLQRIVGDQEDQLDEMELKLRQQATAKSFAAFTVAALVALLYAGIAADAGWWLPKTSEAFGALFWGVMLYATLLPTSFLVLDRTSIAALAPTGRVA